MEIITAIQTHLPLLAVLLVAGGFAGLAAGLFGVGGGIVIVPALFSILTSFGYPREIVMHVAAGTSLAVIIPTGLSSALAHWRRGAVDLPALKMLGPGAAGGALVGGILAGLIGGSGMLLIFSVCMMFISGLMLRGKKGVALVKQLPQGWGRHLLGGGIGFYSALIGVGGGTLSVPTLAASNYPMKVAVGTGSAIGVCIVIPGALSFILSGLEVAGRPPFSLGYVNLMALVVLAPLSALMAPLGAKLAHRLPELWLRRSFGVLLFVIATRMLFKAI